MTRSESSRHSVFARASRAARNAFATATALALFPATVFASEAAHEGNALLWPVINFAIYVAILVVVYRKKIAPALQQRADDVQLFLNRAGAELASVEREIAAVNQRLSRMDTERETILRQLIVEGEQIAVALKDSTREEVLKIERDAVRQRTHEFQRVRFEVMSEMVRRATTRAREKLQSELSEDDNRRLRDEVLSSFLG